MKRRWATFYAILCTLLMVAGFALVFFFAWKGGITQTIAALCGFFLGFVFSPIVHELGHAFFAKISGMQLQYLKAFCFKIVRKKGRKRFSFASPFAAEQTQTIPKFGGDMPHRAACYTIGGLLFSGIFLLLAVLTALGITLIWRANFVAWGMIPYAGYLFFLNALPLEYASGKTDALVYRGIKKGFDTEKCMLSAMEIQGQLFEGKTFAEIEERYYFDLPQLSEEEPLYALLLDLRYRYYLDKEEYEKSADCLNRLVVSQEYLSNEEIERLAAELVYMRSLGGDIKGAEESGRACREFLKEDRLSAKRALAAFTAACGKTEECKLLKQQAEKLFAEEQILGVRRFEKKLFFRIKTE